jgi:hypothetical protein|eukprot:SAG25_NODE_2778_length_1388_cov_2.228860_2_plen_122_part_00
MLDAPVRCSRPLTPAKLSADCLTANLTQYWLCCRMLEGYFLAPATGSYTFRTNSDDASELWVSPVPNSQGNLIKVVELHDCHTVCKKNVQGTTKLRLSKGKSYYSECSGSTMFFADLETRS